MTPTRNRILLLASAAAAGFDGGASAFSPMPPSSLSSLLVRTPVRTSATFPLAAKKSKGGKGFGKQAVEEEEDFLPPSGAVADYDSAADSSAPAPTKNKAGEVVGGAAASAVRREPEELNAGQQALKAMRAQRQAKEDEELRRIREIRDVDAALAEDAGTAAIPEKVAMRMGKRMLPFVGVPLFGSMAAFVGFWYMATYQDTQFQPAAVATTTVALLAVGLLGITYSVLSASWDPDREGSTMGVDEFNKNVGSLKEGLGRSRENALLRERMAGMPEEDIERAIRDLDKRDERRRRESENLKERLDRELE